MNRAILIELVTYTPTLCSFVNKEEKKTVKQEIGLSAVQYYEWKRGDSDHIATDITKLACEEEVRSVVDELVHITDCFFVVWSLKPEYLPPMVEWE